MNLIPDGSESETARDGFLSSRPEWHAIAIGGFLGIVGGVTFHPAVFVFAFVVVTGRGALRKRSNHLKDAAKESAYTGGAFTVMFALTHLFV